MILMSMVKIPSMKKIEYDQLINEGFMSRIAFKGEKHPYVAPFLYVFDGHFMYFLSTKYGKKVQYFQQDPLHKNKLQKFLFVFPSILLDLLCDRG